MKRFFLVMCAALLAASCSNRNSGDFSSRDISLISREEGSGTRSAFIELFGIEETVGGQKIDQTSEEADITNSTEVMLTSVAGNESAIGYVSLGSLNDTVKALRIDGAAASTGNIKSGGYKISRPFNIITRKSGVQDTAADFIRFIMSADGQKVVEDNGYISAAQNPAYIATGKTGTVTVAGSSSVTPVMEKLSEAYEALNPGMNIEVQMSDSTTGVQNAIEGLCDIGMASRDLRESETQTVEQTQIALDGIAVIVNKQNPLSDATASMVKSIFTGEVTTWGDVE